MIPGLSGAIDHIHVYVPSRHKAAGWYRENLGFTVMEEYAFWATDDRGPLTIADPRNAIHLALFRSEKSRPVSLAFGASRDEYRAWKTHLDSVGIEFRESDHDLSHSIYFDDPFENHIEITTYEID